MDEGTLPVVRPVERALARVLPVGEPEGEIAYLSGKVPDDPSVLAAIVAAAEACWPRPRPVQTQENRTPAWRFSGRWWRAPVQARRERPWL